MKMHEHIQQILAQEAQLDSHCLSRAWCWISGPTSWVELADELVFALPTRVPASSVLKSGEGSAEPFLQP